MSPTEPPLPPPRHPRPRVLIADRDPLARWALERILNDHRDIDVVAAVDSAAAAIAAVRTYRPDWAIIDFDLPVTNGVHVTIAARRDHPELKVVLLVERAAAEFEARAPQWGILTVMQRLHAPSRLAPILLGRVAPPPALTGLSRREVSVAQLIADGLSNAQISTALGLSINSVRTYTSRLYRKTGVSNRVQLANLLRD